MSRDILSLINKYLPYDHDSQMQEMVGYAVSSGGKRIRPMLMLQCAEQIGGIDSNIERLAVALECMHNYSLVHDDLPCIDDDDYRRGQLSCHKKFGYGEGVLTGDYLLNSCAEIVFGGSGGSGYLASGRHLMQCGRKMIEGQIADIHSTAQGGDGVTSIEQYNYVAIHKTGALLSASLVIPALYYTMPDIVVANLEQLAHLVGIMYQVADDLAETSSDECSILQVLSRADACIMLDNIASQVDQLMNQLREHGISLPMVQELVAKLTAV